MPSTNPWRAVALLLTTGWASACVAQTPKTPADEPRPPTLGPAARAQGPLRAKVEALLTGYERVPTTEDWKPLGPEALAQLEQIYSDPAALPSTRTRAVASMALVDNAAAAARLRAIAGDAGTDPRFRATAVQALGHRTGEKALPELEAALADQAPGVREAAAQALGRLGTAAARRALEARLAQESDPAVRETLRRSLNQTAP